MSIKRLYQIVLFTVGMMCFNLTASSMNYSDTSCETQACVDKIKKLKKYARNGSPEAMALIGVFYFLGDNLEQHPKKAATWLLRASKKQSPVAYYFLSKMYADGIHFSQNIEKSKYYLDKAAERGYVEALVDKGVSAFVQGNHALAYDYLTQADRKFSAKATYLLAKMTELGLGTQSDVAKAFKLYSKAAARNYKDSASHVARLRDMVKHPPEFEKLGSPQGEMEVIEVVGGKFTIDTHLDFIISDLKQTVYTSRRSGRLIGSGCDKWAATSCRSSKPDYMGPGYSLGGPR